MGDYSKFIDEKRRAVPTPESMVDENGICAFGTFDKEFEKMDLVKLKNPQVCQIASTGLNSRCGKRRKSI